MSQKGLTRYQKLFLFWDRKCSQHAWNMSKVTPDLLAIQILIKAVCTTYPNLSVCATYVPQWWVELSWLFTKRFRVFYLILPYYSYIFLGSKYLITCGEHELDLQESGQINFYVTQVIVHPKYQGADKGYDIAIFKERLFLSTNVHSIEMDN